VSTASPIAVEPLSPGELDQWLSVYNRVAPDDPTTAEEWRAFAAQLAWSVDWLVRAGGEIVGIAHLGPRLSLPSSDHGSIDLAVLQTHRRQGIGTALFAAISDEARDHGLVGVRLMVSAADPEDAAWFLRRGFAEVGRNQQVALDVASAPPLDAAPPDGVEITTLAARPELTRSAWEVAREAVPDIPADPPEQAGPYEQWVALAVDAPWCRREGFFVAVSGDVVVGYAALTFPALLPDVAYHQLTAVRRAWRGRGVAAALKDAQLAYAKQRGIRQLLTENELRNEPIRRLNARMGYQPLPEQITLSGPLAPPR